MKGTIRYFFVNVLMMRYCLFNDYNALIRFNLLTEELVIGDDKPKEIRDIVNADKYKTDRIYWEDSVYQYLSTLI